MKTKKETPKPDPRIRLVVSEHPMDEFEFEWAKDDCPVFKAKENVNEQKRHHRKLDAGSV